MSSSAAAFDALPDPLDGVGPLGTRVIGKDGPPIVLVHGLGRVAASWAFVARHVAPTARLVIADNPGFGRSRHLSVPRTVAEHGEIWEQTLRALPIDPPFHVAGLSLGGMIAPVLASRLGGDCASLTVIGSSSRESGFWRLAGGSLLRMARRFLGCFRFDHRVNMPELVRPATLQRHPDLIDAINRMQQAEGFSGRNGFRQLLAANRFRLAPFLDVLPRRRLVVVGTGDRLVPPRNSHRLAKLLDAPLLELEDVGHDIGFDAPETCAALLLRMARGDAPDAIAGELELASAERS